jgi:hypothetical protein
MALDDITYAGTSSLSYQTYQDLEIPTGSLFAPVDILYNKFIEERPTGSLNAPIDITGPGSLVYEIPPKKSGGAWVFS